MRFKYLLKLMKNREKIVKNIQLVTARPLSVGHQCPTGSDGG